MRKNTVILALLAATLALPCVTRADHGDDNDARVARVSYISGDVSYQRGDVDGWNDVVVNTPLVTGDSLYAPDGGRAELDLGNGIVMRLDGGTQVDLVNNSRDVAQVAMTSGVLDFSARSFPQSFSLEVDSPNGAATILEPGRYRVEVTDSVTTYSVMHGSISLAVDGQQLDVREGESLQLEGTDPPTYSYAGLGARTPFQSWGDGRDSRVRRSTSARYVNRDVVGYEDLDDHGSWRQSRGYGQVWVPSGVPQGWAPYQSGRWIWQDPYGWTWVSNESWGWAPYHYGRWVQADNSWCWVPPPPRGYRGPAAVMSIQAVYAPALVAFVGGRNWGVSLSIGGPAIGWVPLAPAERYYYPWQPAPRVTNNYTNITVNNAVTIVNYNTFATGTVRPIRVAQNQIERAPVIGVTAVGVVPSRGSLVVAPERNPGAQAVPRIRNERPMVARLVPPPKPQQFTQKVVEIEKTGRPVASPIVATAAVGKPFVPGAPPPPGVKAVSALAPGGRSVLKARSEAEVRVPKKIERDIAPPAPAGPRGRPGREQSAPEAPPAAQPVPPPAPAPAAAAPAPRTAPPEARNAPGVRQAQPRQPPAEPPPGKQDAAPVNDRPNPPDATTNDPRARRNPNVDTGNPRKNARDATPPEAQPPARQDVAPPPEKPKAPDATPNDPKTPRNRDAGNNPRRNGRDAAPPPSADRAPQERPQPPAPAPAAKPPARNAPPPRPAPVPPESHPGPAARPVAPPPAPPVRPPQPDPRPAGKPEAKAGPAHADAPATPPQPAPDSKRKAKGKKPPVPAEPAPAPPQDGGK